MILNLLKEHALALVGQKRIKDVRVGLGYTAVQLDDNSVGVAMTFHRDIPSGCLAFEEPLKGRDAAQLIEMAGSADLIQRTVAIATINAVTNRHRDELVTGDSLKIINAGSEDVVGMVGYFGPLVPQLKHTVKELHIFEKSMERAENLHSEAEIPTLLPECSVAIITSTSLVNLTFEGIANAARNCRTVALVGGTTPLVADVFKQYGVTVLSGLVIRDTEDVLRVVSEAGGMKSFNRFVDKVNLVC